jgi:hypothetical protein
VQRRAHDPLHLGIGWRLDALSAAFAQQLLGGEHTAVPMALLMIAGAVLSMVGLLVLARPSSRCRRLGRFSSRMITS